MEPTAQRVASSKRTRKSNYVTVCNHFSFPENNMGLCNFSVTNSETTIVLTLDTLIFFYGQSECLVKFLSLELRYLRFLVIIRVKTNHAFL